MIPRPYQTQAANAILEALEAGKKPIGCLPTGSGKSLIAAMVVSQRPGRTLVISHRKELLQQDMDALYRWDPTVSAGIYSAGMGRRDTREQVIFGGVASIYKRLSELQIAGQFQTVLIDEVHATPFIGSDAVLYTTCLSQLPLAGRCGLTATPYRLDGGSIYEGENAWFDTLAIQITASELVQEGYLSPLVSVGMQERIETDGIKVRQGDFVTTELSQIACDADLVEKAITELLYRARARHHVLLFAVDVAHGELINSTLREIGEDAYLLTGQTPADERAELLARFKAGEIRWLINIGVLTTGFDAPICDCIAVMRPTCSKSLHVQMLGRGMRIHESKARAGCLILDFAGNIDRHGALDGLIESYKRLPTAKEKKEEKERTEEARERQQRQLNHGRVASILDPMTGLPLEMQEVQVHRVAYSLTPAKQRPGKMNLLATYFCEHGIKVRQWICVEYEGRPRYHAEQWFFRRGLKAPTDADAAIDLAEASAPTPESISIVQETVGERQFPKIILEHFAPVQAELLESEETA